MRGKWKKVTIFFEPKPADLYITTTPCSSMVTQDQKLDQTGRTTRWTDHTLVQKKKKNGSRELFIQRRSKSPGCAPVFESRLSGTSD